MNEPERIFRRVRNKKTGELELSESAKTADYTSYLDDVTE